MSSFLNKPISASQPNYLYSIISVALVLLLLGFFGLLLLHTQGLLTYFKEQVNIIIEIEEGTSEEEIVEIQSKLENSVFVKKGTATYISKNDALDILRKDFGEDFMDMNMNNPFYDVITFNARAEYMDSDKLSLIRTKIMDTHLKVSDVFYQETLVDVIVDNIQKVGWLALFIGLFFVFVAVILIHNTIRLAIFANRFLIKNMELVGASWEFISRPYMIRSIKNGFISAIIAISILLLLIFWIKTDMPEVAAMQETSSYVLLFTGLLILGLLITGLSTYYVVHQYLKMRLDDLY